MHARHTCFFVARVPLSEQGLKVLAQGKSASSSSVSCKGCCVTMQLSDAEQKSSETAHGSNLLGTDPTRQLQGTTAQTRQRTLEQLQVGSALDHLEVHHVALEALVAKVVYEQQADWRSHQDAKHGRSDDVLAPAHPLLVVWIAALDSHDEVQRGGGQRGLHRGFGKPRATDEQPAASACLSELCSTDWALLVSLSGKLYQQVLVRHACSWCKVMLPIARHVVEVTPHLSFMFRPAPNVTADAMGRRTTTPIAMIASALGMLAGLS
jgi:hypothetical protein